MAAKIFHMITVYFAFTMASIRRILEYRISLFIGIFAIMSRHAVAVLTLWVIFSRVRSLGGWDQYQILYLYGYVSFVGAIHHLFFMNTFRVEFMVGDGLFDIYLVRPMPVIFQVLLYYIDDDAIGDFIPAVILLYVSSVELNIIYTNTVILVFILGVLGGVMIHFGMNLILSAWSFWFVKSRALIQLFSETRRFSEYPLRIFNPSIQLILTIFVPIAFSGFYPVERILSIGVISSAAYLSLPAGILVLSAGILIWSFGLTKYQSTGS